MTPQVQRGRGADPTREGTSQHNRCKQGREQTLHKRSRHIRYKEGGARTLEGRAQVNIPDANRAGCRLYIRGHSSILQIHEGRAQTLPYKDGRARTLKWW